MPASVAVIVATYNGEAFIESQILSIVHQTHPGIRIFVRDDGSTDNSRQVLAALRERFENLSLVDSSLPATGTATGNFLALIAEVDLTPFDFVFLCDQDDVWDPDKVARAITCMTEAGASGYSSDLVAFDNDKQRSWYVSKAYTVKELDYLFQGASAGCTYALRADAVALVKSLTAPLVGSSFGKHSHDWLIYLSCRSHGLKWFMDQRSTVFYRQHASNVFGALPSLGGLVARFRLAFAGWYREHVLWNAQFLGQSGRETQVMMAVTRCSLRDRIWLALHASDFRRRRRDAVLLALSFLTWSF